MKKLQSKSNSVGGLIFIGAFMTGIGLGMYYGDAGVGTMLGLGVGFILFGLIKLLIQE